MSFASCKVIQRSERVSSVLTDNLVKSRNYISFTVVILLLLSFKFKFSACSGEEFSILLREIARLESHRRLKVWIQAIADPFPAKGGCTRFGVLFILSQVACGGV